MKTTFAIFFIFSAFIASAQIAIVEKKTIKKDYFKDKFDESFKFIKSIVIETKNGKYDKDSKSITFEINKKIDVDTKAYMAYLKKISKDFKKYDHEKQELSVQLGDYSNQRKIDYKFNCPKTLSCEIGHVPDTFVFDLVYEMLDGSKMRRKVLMGIGVEAWLLFGSKEEYNDYTLSFMKIENDYDAYKMLEGMTAVEFKNDKEYLKKSGKASRKAKEFLKSYKYDQKRYILTSAEFTIENVELDLVKKIKGVSFVLNKEATKKQYLGYAFHSLENSSNQINFQDEERFYRIGNSFAEAANKIKSIKDQYLK